MQTIENTERSFSWKGYLWQTTMENGRRIHTCQPWMWYDDNKVFVSNNDILVLELAREETEIRHWDGRVYKPAMACGTVRSVDKFGYGRFDAEIELPQGYNLWPSFWLVGDDRWPFSGEIDICEAWSGNDNYFKMFIAQPPYICPSWRTTTNVHYSDKNFLEHASIGSRNVSVLKQPKNPTLNYIKYSCLWTGNAIEIFVNDKLVRKDTDSAMKISDYWRYIGKTPKMRVIFNLWCENPSLCEVKMKTTMRIKNFHYTPF